jgi:hypothetical protein
MGELRRAYATKMPYLEPPHLRGKPRRTPKTAVRRIHFFVGNPKT